MSSWIESDRLRIEIAWSQSREGSKQEVIVHIPLMPSLSLEAVTCDGVSASLGRSVTAPIEMSMQKTAAIQPGEVPAHPATI